MFCGTTGFVANRHLWVIVLLIRCLLIYFSSVLLEFFRPVWSLCILTPNGTKRLCSSVSLMEIILLITLCSLALFKVYNHCLPLLCVLFSRLSAPARIEEDGWQSSAGGAAAAGEQDISRVKQLAQGQSSSHLCQDDSKRHLLPSKAAGCSRHAVRYVFYDVSSFCRTYNVADYPRIFML